MSTSTTSGALAAQAARAIADTPTAGGKPPTEHHPFNWRGIGMQIIYQPEAFTPISRFSPMNRCRLRKPDTDRCFFR